VESRPPSRHVLVVGGGGYIGNVLVRLLLARDYRVRVLDSLIFDHGSALAGVLGEPRFSFCRGDLRAEADRERAMEGITDVVLLAALVGDPLCKQYPELAREINAAGSATLFTSLAGRGLDRFVFTSTCSNYGLRETEEPATEDSELAPLSLYAETKVELERFILEHAGEVDFHPTVLRVATAYGPSQRTRFDLTISEFTRTLAIGEELLVYDADTWRPYCHTSDISRAVLTVLESPAEAVGGEVFNVGHDDENYTKRMVVDAVLERLGGNGRVRYTEHGSDPRNYRVSFAKIASQLGFQPEHRMPDAVGKLIEAIRGGIFDDVESRPGFYSNRSIAP
jgi:nucleoside-diphosphate-sugar epimerase